VSSHLGVQETLALLERLRSAVKDGAARERTLVQDYAARTLAETRRLEAALADEEAQLAGSTRQAEAELQTVEQHLEEWFLRRKARIDRARKNCRKQAIDRLELEEGRQKYAVQKGTLETEKQQKEAIAANDARWQEFEARLGLSRAGFAALEQDAQRAAAGYGGLRRALGQAPDSGQMPADRDEYQLLDDCEALLRQTEEAARRFRRLMALTFFRALPLWLVLTMLVVGLGGAVPVLQYLKVGAFTYTQAGIALGAAVVLVLAFYFLGASKAAPAAAGLGRTFERARRLQAAAHEKAAAHHQQEAQRIETEVRERLRMLQEHWNHALAEASERRTTWPKLMEDKGASASELLERAARTKDESLGARHAETLARMRRAAADRTTSLRVAHDRKLSEFTAARDAHWRKLEADWKESLRPIFASVRATQEAAAARFAEWRPELWEGWEAPQRFGSAAQFGRLEVDVAQLGEGLPQDARLALPGPAEFALPLLLSYPREGSLLVETAKAGSEAVSDALNNVILRLLSQTPPGKASFTIIDPVRLGQNFAGVMHLADFEENLINNRIWTQATEIEQRLADLNEHMEKVIQMYLRNEYATIAEYNEQAGKIAEKHHFLVIADFPVNFSETAIRRLVNIVSSGARCGVHTLIHWDRRQMLPAEFVLDELRRNSVCLHAPGNTILLGGPAFNGTRLVLESPPAPELATSFLQKVGEASKDSNRVEVPFADVAPPEKQVWSLATQDELRVPIGRTGATKFQYLSIGRGTRQHALIAGKTGSGKSTLFHVMITNLALWCSPEEVEFYLVDFKKGVEFKCYGTHRLPHARVVAIESDREFGLSVLQRVDEELKRRGDLFRQLGVQDVAGFKRAGGGEAMPRSLLMIDEFQEFFVEDDRISQTASVLLDRIVRQGRAFGIHVLLGSQTLGGAYTLARATLGQMVIRIALMCNEADAYLIMDDNNPAPRLLTRPGEGIYNDMAGMMEGNSPFQTVWLSDEEREVALGRVRVLAETTGKSGPAPFVFEGNAPADIRDNRPLRDALQSTPAKAPAAARLWLGAPNSIKGPTEAVLQRQSGNHLLIVGQREESALALLGVGLLGLAAQFPRDAAQFTVLDSTPPETPQREFLDRIVKSLPQPAALARGGDLAEVLAELADDMKRRADDEHAAQAPAKFLFILGLQNFKKLRQEDDFSFATSEETTANPAKLLGELITGGAAVGIHVIATCDTYNNVTRYLGRKALAEFEMRVLFQMSANDSASLIDNPKANNLGLHRALYYNEHEGWLETFRPYALPGGEWLGDAGAALAGR
jgi:S-DNA-T family DNA segregation ATPase FtsK/SpoIIIE